MLDQLQIGRLTELRHWLHRNPEIAGQEHGTIRKITDFVRQYCSRAELLPVAGTGLLLRFRGEEGGRRVLIRGDIDALPIDDLIHTDYVSASPGIGHKCGHDGHAVIICGLAMILNDNPPRRGEVGLLFQPAEENGEGALKVIEDFKKHKVAFDLVYALHNIPGQSLGRVLYRIGNFTPSVVSVAVSIMGLSSHAGEPWHGVNPAGVVAQIIAASSSLEKNNPADTDFLLFTPVFVKVGSKDYGISPGSGEIHYTIRSWKPDVLQEHCKLFENIVNDIALKSHVQCTFEYFQSFEANMNDPGAVATIIEAAGELDLPSTELSSPFTWGEDFGVFTHIYKGAMFGIGAGVDVPALHNYDYDFPDELTPIAIDVFYKIILKSI